MGTLAHGYLIFSISYAAMGLMQLSAPQKLMEISSGISLLPTAEFITRALGLWSILLAVFMKSLVVRSKSNGPVQKEAELICIPDIHHTLCLYFLDLYCMHSALFVLYLR